MDTMRDKPLDIIFISFDESNSDKNWVELITRFPRAKRIHGVEGIDQAHRMASQKSETRFFFVVDGDNRIRPDFHFETPELSLQEESIYVWRCLNPMNSLIYGYGAVKLYNESLLSKDEDSGDKTRNVFVDLATSTTTNYRIIDHIASETHFFHTPEEAWRGAFRECAKLASQKIRGQKSEETEIRLEKWCQVADNNKPNWEWVLKGAHQGQKFGLNSPEEITLINDYHWLHTKFSENE